MRTSRPSGFALPRRSVASRSASRCTRIAGGPSSRRASVGSASPASSAGSSAAPVSERTETLFSTV